MDSDFISDLQGVHQHSLEWPGGANATMDPPVSAPVKKSLGREKMIMNRLRTFLIRFSKKKVNDNLLKINFMAVFGNHIHA